MAATRLPRPRDSSGNNTGVGCHFLLQCRKVKSESEVTHCVLLFATPWTVAYQAPPSMGFSRQEYWSGLPFPSPGDLPNPGIEPRSPALQADALTSELPGKYDPAIPLLGIHIEETRIERDTCTPMFITALFIIGRTWKQPRCPSADECEMDSKSRFDA